MKKLTYLSFPFRAVVCLLSLLLVSSPVLSDQREDSYALLDAVFSDDIAIFTRLLERGADPTYIEEGIYETSHWAMCRAAKAKTTEYLELIAEHGWPLDFRQNQFAGNPADSRSETALFCSVISGSSEPFKYLMGKVLAPV